MKKLFFLLFMCGIFFCPSPGRCSLEDTQAFLANVRNIPVELCWFRMDGVIRHRSRGNRGKTFPISIRGHITDNPSLMLTVQVIFNHDQRYRVTQFLKSHWEKSRIVEEKQAEKNKPTMQEIGLHPGDLTLSFLYWELEQELPTQRIRSQRCRVLRLKNPHTEERVHVFIAEKYFFPLRVQWLKSDHQHPSRTLDFTGFKKIAGLWMVTELKLKSKQWKTFLTLKENIVQRLTKNHGIPEDLFVEK